MTAPTERERLARLICETTHPRGVGGYRMGEPPASVTWCFTRKPSAWHRWWVRFTLGWVWIDQ